jgi:hypothetical protein
LDLLLVPIAWYAFAKMVFVHLIRNAVLATLTLLIVFLIVCWSPCINQ